MNWLTNHKRWTCLILAGTLTLLHFAIVKAQNLDLKTPVERSIKPGVSDSFDIVLTPGQFIQIMVEQQNPGVIATVFTPDAELLMSASGLTLPSFKIAFIAKTAGRYRLEVRARPIAMEATNYKLSVSIAHAATAADEESATISRALQEANHRFDMALVSSKESSESLLRSAIEGYQRALTILTGSGDRDSEARALENLSKADLGLNDYDGAVDAADRAIHLWRSIGDWAGESGSMSVKADSNNRRGYYTDAIANAGDLLAGARARGDISMQRTALTYLYTNASRLREPEDAIMYEQQLLDLVDSPNSLASANILDNIAAQYLVLHEPRTSIAYRERSRAIYETLGRKTELANALGWISLGHQRLGEDSIALNYSNRAAELDPKQTDPALLARMGKTDQAIEFLNKEIVDLHGQGDPFEGRSWLKLADIFEQAQRRDQALDALRQALTAWPPEKKPDGRIDFLAGVAMHYENLGEPATALPIFQEYLRGVLAKGPNGFPQYPGYLAEMARSERDLGMLDQARAQLETAINLREAARARIASPELAASFFTQSRAIFDIYIDVLMRQGHVAEALEANERARAHALIGNLGDSISKIREGVEPQLIEKERNLQNQINEAALLNNASRTQTISAQLEVLRGTIRQSSPAYASLTEPLPLALSEIRTKVLGPETTLLEYSLSDKAASYVWEVTTGNLRSVKLPPRSDIDKAARRVRTLLSEPAKNDKAEKELAAGIAALSKMVLEPLGPLPLNQRLLIVSDGILDFVPFAALPDPKTGTPLIVSHEIVRLPSASALAVIREGVAARRPQSQRKIAVLADPVFNARDERLSISFQPKAMDLTDPLSRSLLETGMTLPRLSFSSGEAASIKAAAPTGSTLVQLGTAANRDFVTSGALGDYSVVHFATHGLLNSESPALSGIVFSLFDDKGKPQDGFLRLHEIYNLHLNAGLVVLSACQTALGNQVEGEGIISLSRGFFYAGAARVLASLWTVDDKATAALMGEFYGNLLSKRMTPAAALRATQTTMWKSQRWSSPYYWAGFELQGEWK